MKISINDVEIEMVTCGHCGAVPTEADAQEALNQILLGPTCAICQQKIKLTELKLEHNYYSGDGERRWVINGKYEELVELSHPSNTHWVHSTMHVACLKRVAPGTKVTDQ